GAGGARQSQLVAGRRPPSPRVPLDRRRAARARRAAEQLARILHHRHHSARGAARHLMTEPGLEPRLRPVHDYLARIAAALPGPARARAAILAALRAGRLAATEAPTQPW